MMLRSLKIENQIRVLLEHKYINQFITDNGAMHSHCQGKTELKAVGLQTQSGWKFVLSLYSDR